MGERGIKDAVGDAIGDVRNKLIDEGWFGKRTGAPGQPDAVTLGWELEGSQPRTGDERRAHLSFAEAWATREPADKLDPDYELNKGMDR